MRRPAGARTIYCMARTKATHGWSRVSGGGWAEVVLGLATSARVTAVVRTAFPSAVVHAVVTDVLGPHEARIETADGRRLTVVVDAAFHVTGFRTTGAERRHPLLPAAA
jgi:hypothetical protein